MGLVFDTARMPLSAEAACGACSRGSSEVSISLGQTASHFPLARRSLAEVATGRACRLDLVIRHWYEWQIGSQTRESRSEASVLTLSNASPRLQWNGGGWLSRSRSYVSRCFFLHHTTWFPWCSNKIKQIQCYFLYSEIMSYNQIIRVSKPVSVICTSIPIINIYLFMCVIVIMKLA